MLYDSMSLELRLFQAHIPCHAVGSRGIFRVTNNNPKIQDIDVERMIDHVHMLVVGKGASSTVDRAGEGGIGVPIRCLPDLPRTSIYDASCTMETWAHHGKFWENIVDHPPISTICSSVKEHNYTRPRIDQ